MRLRSLHRAYPGLHPFVVVHWVPEQMNIKAVTAWGMQVDLWLQPCAVFGHRFSGISWHMSHK